MQLRQNSIGQTIQYLIFPGSVIVLNNLLGVWLLVNGISNYQAAANFKNKALSATGIITKTTIQANTTSSGMAAPPSYISTFIISGLKEIRKVSIRMALS